MAERVLGIWVGGRGARMGGVQKALLRAPGADETLLARLLRLAREVSLEPVLIGRAELGADALGVPQFEDTTPGIGPLGGLDALFEHAGARPALAIACDMPYVTVPLLQRLCREASEAELLAPRDHESGKWHPLFARHDPARVRPQLRAAIADGARSFQALFRRLPVRELALSVEEEAQLRDWDTPEDMR